MPDITAKGKQASSIKLQSRFFRGFVTVGLHPPPLNYCCDAPMHNPFAWLKTLSFWH